MIVGSFSSRYIDALEFSRGGGEWQTALRATRRVVAQASLWAWDRNVHGACSPVWVSGLGPITTASRRRCQAVTNPRRAGLNRTRQNGPMPVAAPDMMWFSAVLCGGCLDSDPGSIRG
jgi:hypothetical protein